MNRVFHIVWSSVKLTWIITSELTRKCGRPLQGKKRAASLVALLGATSLSTQAAYTETVTPGMTVNREIVSGWNTQKVSGGTVIDTILNNAAQELYGTGSKSIGTVINNDGKRDCGEPMCSSFQLVSNDAVAMGTVVNTSGAIQQVVGDVTKPYTSGGVAIGTIINDGAQYVGDIGYATDTIVNGGLQWVTFQGTVNNTTVNGGSQELFIMSTATNTTVNTHGQQLIYSESTAIDTILNGGTQSAFGQGSTAENTIINAGGTSFMNEGARAIATTINRDGMQYIDSESFADRTTLNGGAQQVYGQVTNTIINTDGVQWIYADAFSSNTEVNAGGRVNIVGGTVADVTINNKGIMALYDNVNLDGKINNNGNILLNDQATANGDIQNTGILSLATTQGIASATVNGNIFNAGSMRIGLDAKRAGSVLNINGDYHGENGTLVLNTALGGDNSARDRLIITGNASGKTDVSINHLGNQGDQTINGIEIVQVDGSSTPGAFWNSKAIRAGLYNYTVVQKGGNYYLTSEYISPEPTPSLVKDISTSAGGYLANISAANQVFAIRMADRQTGMEYLNPQMNNTESSFWLRQLGGHNRSQADVLRTQSNRYIVQMGGDIINGEFAETDKWSVGLMAGYADQNSTTTSVRSRYDIRSKSNLRGYSTGIYGTWLQDAGDRSGIYVDSWIQYNWFQNTVREEGQLADNYRSKGFSASLEGGYSYKVVDGDRTDFFIEPQLQVVWSDVSADGHNTRNGIYVQDIGQGNIQTRVGVKAYLQGHSTADDHTGRLFKPYVETNWIHNTREYGVRMSGSRLSQDGAKDLAEVKTGVEAQLARSASLWGGVAVQLGNHGYSDTQGHLGIRYQF